MSRTTRHAATDNAWERDIKEIRMPDSKSTYIWYSENKEFKSEASDLSAYHVSCQSDINTKRGATRTRALTSLQQQDRSL